MENAFVQYTTYIVLFQPDWSGWNSSSQSQIHSCLSLTTLTPLHKMEVLVRLQIQTRVPATSWLRTEARLWCSPIFPFSDPCFPAAPGRMALTDLSSPYSLSSVHSQPEVQLLEDQILWAATCPRKDSCSCTACSRVAKGAEVVLTIWKGARGAGDPFRSLRLRKLQRVGGTKLFEGNWKNNEKWVAVNMDSSCVWVFSPTGW